MFVGSASLRRRPTITGLRRLRRIDTNNECAAGPALLQPVGQRRPPRRGKWRLESSGRDKE